MPLHPLAEVFGFPTDNFSQEAERHRSKRLCPFNNRVPNCTKDKAENPLGTCSVFDGDRVVITCPIRFRQNWHIVDDAATFFFPTNTTWTTLTEIRLNDRHGKSAGNIDVVLVAYNADGQIIDFGALEIQSVYISGNIRNAFDAYMRDPVQNAHMDWSHQRNYPRPDYLSSSRKRLAPQLIYKGGILHSWNKKIAVAVDSNFFNTLPQMDTVTKEDAELVWLVYDLQHDPQQNRYHQKLARSVYTRFKPALDTITNADPGGMQDFTEQLQGRLAERLGTVASSDSEQGPSSLNDLDEGTDQ